LAVKDINIRFKNLLFLLRESQYKIIGRKLLHRFYSQTRSYCLRRDLRVPFEPQQAQIPLKIRPLSEYDIPAIFGDADTAIAPDFPVEEKQELALRLEHVHANIPTCYVAVTADDKPAYMQWLMGYQENEQIQAYFNGTFPVLADDEALLENALTLHDYRGKGIMPWAMARIAEHGAELGARWVITFVEEHNIASLKGCKRAGFLPYMVRSERWILFHRMLTFSKLPAQTPYSFDIAGQNLKTHPA